MRKHEINLRMLTVPKSDVKILKFWKQPPLTRKVGYGRQAVIKGQGRFTKRGLPWPIPPVMWMGYKQLSIFTYGIMPVSEPLEWTLMSQKPDTRAIEFVDRDPSIRFITYTA